MSRWVRHVVAGATVPILVTGCIGATDRSEFDDEVRRRGGGITSAWIDDALDVAAAELDVADGDDLEVLTLLINGTSRTVTVNARRGDRPEFVDSVTVREGEWFATVPIRDADELPLDDLTIALGELPLDALEEMVDTALVEFGEPDSYVTTVSVSRGSGEPRITMQIASIRRTGAAVFDANGVLQEIEA